MTRHPGNILQHDFLAPLGLSASDVARGLAVDRSTVSRLLAGKQPVTPVMAARLGAYFSVPARWWLQMQADFDAERVEADPTATAEVTPLPPNPDVMLTPRGVLMLTPPEHNEPYLAADVHVVRYNNGAVALVSDDR